MRRSLILGALVTILGGCSLFQPIQAPETVPVAETARGPYFASKAATVSDGCLAAGAVIFDRSTTCGDPRPANDRAFGSTAFTWGGHDYLAANLGKLQVDNG